VAFETVCGVQLRVLCHERVAKHLGHDRSRHDRRAKRVTINDQRLRNAAARNAPLSVDQDIIGEGKPGRQIAETFNVHAATIYRLSEVAA